MSSDPSRNLDTQYPEYSDARALSIVLIGPDQVRREAVARVLTDCNVGQLHELSSYPPSLDDVPRLLERHYNVIVIDLDSVREYALELVESICANSEATVMAYSEKADSELLVRCMRAGAREFLKLPLAQSAMAKALVRASARRPATHSAKKSGFSLKNLFRN